MRWKRGPRSSNLEDRRGRGPRRVGLPRLPGGLGGRARIPLPTGRGGRLSLGSVVVLVALLYFLGPEALTGGGLVVPSETELGMPTGAPPSLPPSQTSPREEELVDFVSFVLDDLQSTWAGLVPGYRDARLVLFRDVVRSDCGIARAAMGPFYCPADQKVYIDLVFYEELRRRFGAPGDFAQAYVLAHEIGHHLQHQSGLEQRVRSAQRDDPSRANELSVRMELQADCLAGVWGHSTGERGILEAGDVEEGLRAAAAIGDDRIQRMSQGHVQPETFTHGSSEQRMRWLRRGLESGDPAVCDSFETARP